VPEAAATAGSDGVTTPGENVRENGGPPDSAIPETDGAATSPSPESDTAAPSEAPAEAAPDDVRLRFGDRIRPDTATEKESNLEYYEVFNPSIVPHKRGRVLNSIDTGFDVVLERGNLRPVSLGTTSHAIAAGRDTFSAEAMVESNGHDPVPLPSVSADDAILEWEAVPPQDVRFFRDAADNLYARLPLPGRARLTWRLAAPRTYFARRLDSLGRIGPGSLPAAVRPDPPAVVKAQAREVARGIGLSPTASLASMLDHLVYHFRGFTPGEPPTARAGIYRDLALGRVGVCRHRAFAFVVTAQGLGIPARYVYNEAHVFVEVWLPATDDAPAGWTRIDLGGGADTLDVHGGHDKTMHRPPEDTFATPPGFNSDALAGATEVRGLPAAPPAPEPAVADAGTSAAARPVEDAGAAPGETGGGDGASPAETAEAQPLKDGPFRWPASMLAETNTSRSRAPSPDALPDPRIATALSVTVAARDVVRGVPFQVEGFVRGQDGTAVRDGFVQVLLEPPAFSGRARGAPWLLGVARLDAQGRYVATVVIPPGLPPGAYEVAVEFPGTTTHRGVVGR
jgi:transglutaminase-like putative cysteine protease